MRFTMLEKNKIIKIWHYNKEHNISNFMFPLVWDIMFNQLFISSDTLPLIEYIVSIIENVDINASNKNNLLITYKNGKKQLNVF